MSPETAGHRALLQRGVTALRHRGPDAQGIWLSASGEMGLGHARLSVVAPDKGSQPLLNETGDVVAVVSGEFYDYRTLRAQLVAKGHHFRTEADGEILVHLYEEHGLDCLKQLRGEFAWILWDSRQRRLVAARDRFGVRPLVWWQQGGELKIASEAKALLAMGVPAGWDEDALGFASQLQYLPPGKTLFAGVRELRPGHLMIHEQGQTRVRCYWDMDLPKTRAAVPAAEAINTVRQTFKDAVTLRLDADRAVCAQLSGGIDSTAVVAIAAEHHGPGFPVYTVGFDDGRYDETHLAEASAKALAADLRVVRVDRASIVEHLYDAIAHGEGIAINGHIAAKFLLSRAMHQDGFRVTLTGEGADEVFAGYAHLRTDAGTSGDLMATNLASAGLMLPEGEQLDLSAVAAALGYVPTWLAAKASLGCRVAQLTDGPQDAAGQLLECVDVPGQLAGRHRVDQSTYLWSRLALAGYILRTLGDGMEMAHSIEGRLPFLDHVLFEQVRALPMNLKIRRGVEKFVFREAMRGLVPEAVRTREKHPFLAPPLALASSAAVQDLLRSRSFEAVPHFQPRLVREVLNRLPAMNDAERRAWDPPLMLAYSAAVIGERYFT